MACPQMEQGEGARIGTMTCIEIARAAIGPRAWHETRASELARQIGGEVGGTSEVHLDIFLEQLCVEHAAGEVSTRE